MTSSELSIKKDTLVMKFGGTSVGTPYNAELLVKLGTISK